MFFGTILLLQILFTDFLVWPSQCILQKQVGVRNDDGVSNVDGICDGDGDGDGNNRGRDGDSVGDGDNHDGDGDEEEVGSNGFHIQLSVTHICRAQKPAFDRTARHFDDDDHDDAEDDGWNRLS